MMSVMMDRVQSACKAWANRVVVSLIGLTLFSLPGLWAAGVASAASQAPVDGENAFELRVVGPDGKPVPGATVEIRSDSSSIRRGKLVRSTAYGIIATADAEGVLGVGLPAKSARFFGLFITIPGYGPYWASWSSDNHEEPIPRRFTAELEAGWSVGGIVVDPEGKPIRGAKIHPSIEFKKKPGDHQQLAIGDTLVTDANGKWRFDSVPVSLGSVSLSIDHPDFKPGYQELGRAGFGLANGAEPTGKLVMDRGLTVTGKVTDEDGKPIAGARVRTKFMNDVREASTGEDGSYRLVGCEPQSARIVVSAKYRATDMKELNLGEGIGSVDFRMKPGGTVRIRVLDDQGNPAPKARIFFQQWRGRFSYFEFDHVSQYANDDGTWVWNEAPLDEFRADICPPTDSGMQLVEQPLIAREAEYVFRLPPALVVSGQVIDAETKEPIKEFRVVPGVRRPNKRVYWSTREGFTAKDGRYEVRERRVTDAFLVRIEANGYDAAISREIQATEGKISVDFALKPGKDVAGKVVTPGLQPAKGAIVALGIEGTQINIKNGEFDNGSTHCDRKIADEAGRFRFPSQDKDFQLIITHPSGYARINATPGWETMKIIRLEPWARVEGTFRIGRKPTSDVPLGIRIFNGDSHGPNGPNLFTQHTAVTGPDGKFVFERVIPGQGRIGRELFLTVDDGARAVTSTCQVAANFPAGKTTRLELGGTGRAVVGKLKPAEGLENGVRWNFALVTVATEMEDDPQNAPYFTATVDRDGSFRIDDMPEGKYLMNVRFDRAGGGVLTKHRFEVGMPEPDQAEKPVDLGVLKLDAVARP
jgi:uncharacterized GH25 family protein